MNKKEHLRSAPTLLQNEKTRKDYKAIPLYRKKKRRQKNVEHLAVILKGPPT